MVSGTIAEFTCEARGESNITWTYGGKSLPSTELTYSESNWLTVAKIEIGNVYPYISLSPSISVSVSLSFYFSMWLSLFLQSRYLSSSVSQFYKKQNCQCCQIPGPVDSGSASRIRCNVEYTGTSPARVASDFAEINLLSKLCPCTLHTKSELYL